MSAQPQDLADLLDEALEEDEVAMSDTPLAVQQPAAPRPKFKRGRNFVFTLNNPTRDEYKFWKKLLREKAFRTKHRVRFVIFQTEKSASGTTHLQGYVELANKFTPGQVRTHFGIRVHFENRRGTQAQAIAYIV